MRWRHHCLFRDDLKLDSLRRRQPKTDPILLRCELGGIRGPERLFLRQACDGERIDRRVAYARDFPSNSSIFSRVRRPASVSMSAWSSA